MTSISGASNLQKEIGTQGYILKKLLGPQCPLVRGFRDELIPFIDNNFDAFERQVSSPASCTTFAYDVTRVSARYYNSCITASSNEPMGEPGAVTPVSFGFLIDELRWGRYKGQQLPASLQILFLPPAWAYTLGVTGTFGTRYGDPARADDPAWRRPRGRSP